MTSYTSKSTTHIRKKMVFLTLISRSVTTQTISTRKKISGNRHGIVGTVGAAAAEATAVTAVMTVHAFFKVKKFEYPHDIKSL